MKCQNCENKKVNFYYTEVINGSKSEIYLCTDCAKKLGCYEKFNNINISSFFPTFLNMPTNMEIGYSDEKRCKGCNYSYNDFVNSGKFGCPECYNEFSDNIDIVLGKIHGSNNFVKETDLVDIDNTENPKGLNTSSIDSLSKKLKECIKLEDYEQAAILRDMIKKLKKEE